MIPKTLTALVLALALGLAACNGGNENAGGEAGTPAGNVPESDPQGVGGTSNQ